MAAWEYNFSEFDSTVMEEMPADKCADGSQDCSCVAGVTYGEWQGTNRQVKCNSGISMPVKEREVFETKVARSNACYQYSCYYQALSFVEMDMMSIQPLTQETKYAIEAIEALTPEKLGKKTGVKGKDTHKDADESFSADMWDAGAGTSSMEGLLWTWRTLSDNWNGVWNKKSEYENGNSQAILRNNLPDSEHQKHIIMVSDGEDTDGEFNGSLYADSSFEARTLNGAKGFIIPKTANDVPFNVCDAHTDVDSITLDNYEQVCKAIAEQNIKVHTILYGFSGDPDKNPLIKCSEITGGQYHNNVSPAALETKLRQIFVEFAVARIQLSK